MKKVLNNKEIKELSDSIFKRYGISFSKKDKFEREENLLFVNSEPMFLFHEEKPFPVLKNLLKNNILKKITVDMGAVKFVVNGADVMRPGIKKIDDAISKDDFVSVVDELHGKPLAVGLALFPSAEMQAMTSGRVIKNLHWVGDKVWGHHP